MTRCKQPTSSSVPRPRNRERNGAPAPRRRGAAVSGFLVVALAVRAAAPEPPQPDPAGTLCGAHDKIYFNCTLSGSGKVVSLCGSADLRADGASLQYRFGRKELLELEAPPLTASPLSFFRAGGYARAQVTQWSIGFKRGRYHYELFDSRDGDLNPPSRESGIRVRRDAADGGAAGKATTLHCAQPAFSLLGQLHPLLKCDDALTFGGCKLHGPR